MIRPTPGELLRGIREGLQESVLPALPPGNAQRQLRAALHALARLERSWDRLPASLAEDLADMQQTIRGVLDAETSRPLPTLLQELAARLAAPLPAAAAVPGIGDRALAQAAARHLELQEILDQYDAWLRAQADGAVRIQQRGLLSALYRRMLVRELAANAAAAGED